MGKNKLYYILNEERKTLVKILDNKDAVKDLNKYVLVAKSINEKGEINIEIIGENSNSDNFHDIAPVRLIKSNKIILPLKDGSNYRKWLTIEAKD